jgi:hypothetical protein
MPQVFEHLLDIDPENFIEVDEMDSSALLSAAAVTTSDMWEEIGGAKTITEIDRANSRAAFQQLTDPTVPEKEKKAAIAALRVPAAVKHLAGMLSEYDWDYVEQAKEIRGYVAAQLIEKSKHPDAKVSLQALRLLGTLTEVGSFTERIEITKKDVSADELEARIRSKLKTLLPPTVEVETVLSRPSAN